MERVFKLAGKTHYSNVSYYQYWFIGTGCFCYWLLPVNSPIAVHIWKHVFPKGSNDSYTVGEFFGTSFYQYHSKHGAQVQKHSKRKLQILNADLSSQFLMRPAGLSCFKIMRPLWESCVWDAGGAGKKITAPEPLVFLKECFEKVDFDIKKKSYGSKAWKITLITCK